MKKVIRLTESDLVRLVNRVVKEQFDSEMESPQDNVNSGYEELKSRLERYRNKMDRFLDGLKSSGEQIDGRRFLKQIQRQSDQIFYDIDEKSDVNIDGFGELQDELFKYFRSKIKSLVNEQGPLNKKLDPKKLEVVTRLRNEILKKYGCGKQSDTFDSLVEKYQKAVNDAYEKEMLKVDGILGPKTASNVCPA